MSIIIQNISSGTQNIDIRAEQIGYQPPQDVLLPNDTVENALDNLYSTSLAKSGGTMTGSLNMGNNAILGISTSTNNSSAVNLGYLSTNYSKKPKPGSNISIVEDLDGRPIISTSVQPILPVASTSTLGGVKVDGSSITISPSGVIRANVGGGGGSASQSPLFIDLYDSINATLSHNFEQFRQGADIEWKNDTRKNEFIEWLQNKLYEGKILQTGQYTFIIYRDRNPQIQDNIWYCTVQAPNGVIIPRVDLYSDMQDTSVVSPGHIDYYFNYVGLSKPGETIPDMTGWEFYINVTSAGFNIDETKYIEDFYLGSSSDIYTIDTAISTNRNCYFNFKYVSINSGLLSITAPVNLAVKNNTIDSNFNYTKYISSVSPDNDVVRIETESPYSVHVSITKNRISLDDSNFDFTMKSIKFNMPINYYVGSSTMELYQEYNSKIVKIVIYVDNFTTFTSPSDIDISYRYDLYITENGVTNVTHYPIKTDPDDPDKFNTTSEYNDETNMYFVELSLADLDKYLSSEPSIRNLHGYLNLGR